MFESSYLILLIAASIGMSIASKLFPVLLYAGLAFMFMAILILFGVSKFASAVGGMFFIVILFGIYVTIIEKGNRK